MTTLCRIWHLQRVLFCGFFVGVGQNSLLLMKKRRNKNSVNTCFPTKSTVLSANVISLYVPNNELSRLHSHHCAASYLKSVLHLLIQRHREVLFFLLICTYFDEFNRCMGKMGKIKLLKLKNCHNCPKIPETSCFSLGRMK